MEIVLSEASEENSYRREGEVPDPPEGGGDGTVEADPSGTPPGVQDARFIDEMRKTLRDVQEKQRRKE